MKTRAICMTALTALLLAGCTANDDNDPADPVKGDAPVDPWIAVQQAMTDVPCESDAGPDTSPNLLQLANLSYPEEAGIHGEIDVRGNLLLHARYAQGGFEMVDISDPMNPKDLGAYDYNGEDRGSALDVKFTPDNATALVGLGSGILMVDVRDTAKPQQVGRWNFTDARIPTDPAPRTFQNAHMFYTARIADQDWVFLAPNTNTGVWILRMDGTPDARTLTFVTQTLPVEGGPLGPHDIFVTKDEVDGNWYLYSADGFHGWTAFNVNDPTEPMIVGGIANPVEGAYTHTVQTSWVNGRRLVSTIGEIGANALRVYDATIMAAPVLLGVWQADTGPGSTEDPMDGAAAPEHNFNVVAGKLYLSYYSYGMYVIDLNALTGLPVVGTAELQPIAHYGNNAEGGGGGTVNVWDTVLKDGIIYLGDIDGGLVVIGYGCNVVPDASLTSTG